MACMKNGFVVGSVLDGRYEAVSPLNHGSFGMVYLAKDLTTDELVAIKCLSKCASPKDTMMVDTEDVTAELMCHDQLGHHPNIVNLVRSFENQAHLYLILEYCSMGDLYEAIRLGRGPLQTENVRDFMLELVGAVEHMHSKGFYHRDIKPENIFLTSDGAMKLGDLGLATTDAWSHEASVGSDRYMAPEQYSPGEDGYSPAKADVWAIAICLLNVLFGRNPFITPSETDKLFADFARDNQSLFDIFPSMSQDTFNVLVNAMAIDPAKRSLPALREALEKVVSFTTEEEVLDDFCTETPEVAPAAANREPLRTPSISSPQVDANGAFPWSKALHTSLPHQARQLSTVLDTESYSEDLFAASEKDRLSWYSMAQNSSMTSGLDSGYDMSYKSMALNPPLKRYQRSMPMAVPSSLPARIANFSSIFGKKENTVSQSWTDIWDEDEEEASITHAAVIDKRREQNSRTFSHDSKRRDATLKDISDSQSNVRNHSPPKSPLEATADGASDHDVFILEDAGDIRPSSSKQPNASSVQDVAVDSTASKRNILDKWAALGNRRRDFNNNVDAHAEVKGKWMNTRDWRAGFGLKVFSGTGGRMGSLAWDKEHGNETANVKVRNWRQKNSQAELASPQHLVGATDDEWIGAL